MKSLSCPLWLSGPCDLQQHHFALPSFHFSFDKVDETIIFVIGQSSRNVRVGAFLQVDSLGWGSKPVVKHAQECSPPLSLSRLWLWASEDGLGIPMNSVSPISLWQEVISGEGEAADRTELGILWFILRGAPNICFLYMPRLCSGSHHLLAFISGESHLHFSAL